MRARFAVLAVGYPSSMPSCFEPAAKGPAVDARGPPSGFPNPYCAIAVIPGMHTEIPRFAVHEIAFGGPSYGPGDAPGASVDVVTHWTHESGHRLAVHGFWDGDGAGRADGDVSAFVPPLPASGYSIPPSRTFPRFGAPARAIPSSASRRTTRDFGNRTPTPRGVGGFDVRTAPIPTGSETRTTPSSPDTTTRARPGARSGPTTGGMPTTSGSSGSRSREIATRIPTRSRF